MSSDQISVTVLYDGFSEKSKDDPDVVIANCTCTLVQSKYENIIVDTMTSWDKDKILAGLAKHNLKPDDISIVVSTHGHSDHLGNNNLFLKAKKHIVGQSISQNINYFIHDFAEPYCIDDDIEIIATPGHTSDSVSLIVQNSHFDGKTVAIVGDLFEKYEDISDAQIWIDVGSDDSEDQYKNRSYVAEIADIIIPGHGPLFEVNQQIRLKLKEQMNSFIQNKQN